MKIGEKLRIIRKKLDINQQDFALKLEVSLKTYQNYESNKYPAKLDIICNLIEVFKVNPNWLFINQGNIFLDSTEINDFSPETYLKEGYDITDFELELIKDEFLSSPPIKKSILKLLRAKAKKKEALNDIESILKDLQESF